MATQVPPIGLHTAPARSSAATRRERRLAAPEARPWLPAEWPRRALNVTAALLGFVIAAPAIVLVAILIKLTSRGPVIYAQERVGLDRRWRTTDRRLRSRERDGRRARDLGGRPFTIYKFRTMRAQSAPDAQVWASPDDPRVTPVGRVLRQYRLDELPQLLNVLRGEMNVVGPRPEQLRVFAQLRGVVKAYSARQQVLPGITGWAQINQSYDRCVDDVRRKVALDLEYVARRSALQDLRIMLKTVPVMLFKRGAW